MLNFGGDKSPYKNQVLFKNPHRHLFGGDWHLFSKYNDDPLLEALVLIWLGREAEVSTKDYQRARLKFGPEVCRKLTYEIIVQLKFYLKGDIVDLKCVPMERLAYALMIHLELVALFNPPFKDPHFVEGNHDSEKWVEKTWEQRYLRIASPSGRVMAVEHAHRLLDELTGKPKWQKYCDKPNGSTKWGLIKTDILDDMDRIKARRPLKKGFTDFADKRAHELGVDIISFNHFHTDERWYKKQHSYVHIGPAHCLYEVWF